MRPIGQALPTVIASGRRPAVAMLIVTIALGSTRAAAQGPGTHRTAVWAAAAIGPTRPYDWAVVGSAGLRYSRVLMRVRYAITFENPGARVDDFGILVGVVVTRPTQRGQLSVGAGAGRVRQVYNCFLCSGQTFPATTGLLLDVEGRLALAPRFGLAGYVFGDLNSRLSFGGLAFGLFVGGL